MVGRFGFFKVFVNNGTANIFTDVCLFICSVKMSSLMSWGKDSFRGFLDTDLTRAISCVLPLSDALAYPLS